MNLRERWSRERPPVEPGMTGTESLTGRPTPVLDIATGRPITPGLPLADRRRRMLRAGVVAAVVIAVVALLQAIDMRSRQAGPALPPAPATMRPENVLPPDLALLPSPLPPVELPSATPSGEAELAAPPEAAILPPQAETVLAAPMADDAPEPARKPSSALVFDAGAGAADGGGPDGDGASAVLIGGGSKAAPATAMPRSGRTARAVLTKGTVIPAVLESVIDTRKPGTVRAVIGVDVRSADGDTLLVPRSSRLIGQYRVESGRTSGWAYVLWTRLVRPDGTEVPLASAGEGARFMENYAAAPLVSMVGDARGPADAVRARRGEPVRVVAARNFALGGK